MRDFERCAVPPDTTANGKLGPVNVERASGPGLKAIAGDIGRVDFDGFSIPEAQPTPHCNIERTITPDCQPLPDEFIVGDFEVVPIPPDAAASFHAVFDGIAVQAIGLDPIAVHVERTVVANGQSVAGKFVVGHFELVTVPPNATTWLHAVGFNPVAIDVERTMIPDNQSVAGELIVSDFQFVAIPPDPTARFYTAGFDPGAVNIQCAVVPDDQTVSSQFVVGDFDLVAVDPDPTARIHRQTASPLGFQPRFG